MGIRVSEGTQTTSQRSDDLPLPPTFEEERPTFNILKVKLLKKTQRFIDFLEEKSPLSHYDIVALCLCNCMYADACMYSHRMKLAQPETWLTSLALRKWAAGQLRF